MSTALEISSLLKVLQRSHPDLSQHIQNSASALLVKAVPPTPIASVPKIFSRDRAAFRSR